MPAIVAMIPDDAVTFLMRKLPLSEMYMLPATSNVTASGASLALVAGPPSPANPEKAFCPAATPRIPVAKSTRRIALPSAM